MKGTHVLKRNLTVLSLTLALIPISAWSQGTAFTYQGLLADGGSSANGSYELRFTLYDDASGGGAVAGPITNSPIHVSNGLFTVTLDFGTGVFTGYARWLEIGVRTNGSAGDFTPLSPRQPLTPSPYAIYAPTAGVSVTAESAATVSANGVGNSSLQPNAVTSDKIANGTITGSDLSAALASNTFWRLSGNAGTTPGTHFVGTTDGQPLELKVNGQRALRMEWATNFWGDASVNVIGGSPYNSVGPDTIGAVVAGGGYAYNPESTFVPNRVEADYSSILGGMENTIKVGHWGDVIAGGWSNSIQNSAASTIGGGSLNEIGFLAHESVINGGVGNRIEGVAYYSTIGGGIYNSILTNASRSVIGGGGSNQVAPYAYYASVAGGLANRVGTNADYGVVGGGQGNSVDAESATIGGGTANMVASDAPYSTIGGGSSNMVAQSTEGITIGGGIRNEVDPHTHYSAIGGGIGNSIQFASGGSTIAGGTENGVGHHSAGSTVSGGVWNQVEDLTPRGTIGGGFSNFVSGSYATVPGGYLNRAQGEYSFAAGQRASALHQGAFVWADSTDADFASSWNNQFKVRASGGVYFEAGGYGISVDGLRVLAGVVESTQLGSNAVTGPAIADGAVTADKIGGVLLESQIPDLDASKITSGRLSDARLSTNVALRVGGNAFIGSQTVMAGQVGIGTPTPAETLHVVGNVQLDKSGATPGELILRTPTRNDPGRYTLKFANNYLAPLTGDDTQGMEFGFYSAFAKARTNDAVVRVHGKAVSDWGTYLELTHDGTIGKVGTDAGALEAQPGGQRALRLEPNTNGAPNIIAGSPVNTVSPGVVAATIAGGGATQYGVGLYGGAGGGWAPRSYVNLVSADFSTIGGGGENAIAAGAIGSSVGGGVFNSVGATSLVASITGGAYNTISNDAMAAVIAGGFDNRIGTNSEFATIGGGSNNLVNARAKLATIAGGWLNEVGEAAAGGAVGGGYANRVLSNAVAGTISGGSMNEISRNASAAVIGGGAANVIRAGATYASIPGGYNNEVGGSYGLAAGRRAKSLHTGSFVWADSQSADFASTGNNQFLIRASGGVGIGTAGPQMPLHVAGSGSPASVLIGEDYDGGGYTALVEGVSAVSGGYSYLQSVGAAGVSWGNLVLNSSGGNVGIHTTSPGATLDVAGTFRLGVGGTTMKRIQTGTITVGTGTAGVNIRTNTFTTAFASTPRVVLSARGEDYADTFVVTARAVTTTGFKVNIIRIDQSTSWSQNLHVDWVAWEE